MLGSGQVSSRSPAGGVGAGALEDGGGPEGLGQSRQHAATEDVSDGEPRNPHPHPASRTSQRVSGHSVNERYSKTPTVPSWSRAGPGSVKGWPGCWGAGRRASCFSLQFRRARARHGPDPGPPGSLGSRVLVGASSPAFVCRHPEAREKGTCRPDSVCAARGAVHRAPRPGEQQVRRSRCAAQPWPRTTRPP